MEELDFLNHLSVASTESGANATAQTGPRRLPLSLRADLMTPQRPSRHCRDQHH